MEYSLPFSNLDELSSTSRRNWRHMKQRFDDYLKINNIDNCLDNNSDQVSSLLMFLGGNSLDVLLETIFMDGNKDQRKIKNLLAKIENLCLPNFILLYERFKFFTRKQMEFEDLNKFVCALQVLGKCCEFEKQHNEFMIDRIVDGVYSDTLRGYLLSVPKLDMESVIKICKESCQTDNFGTCFDGFSKSTVGSVQDGDNKTGVVAGNAENCNFGLTDNKLLRNPHTKEKKNSESSCNTLNEKNKTPNFEQVQNIISPRRQTRSSLNKNTNTLKVTKVQKIGFKNCALRNSDSGQNDSCLGGNKVLHFSAARMNRQQDSASTLRSTNQTENKMSSVCKISSSTGKVSSSIDKMSSSTCKVSNSTRKISSSTNSLSNSTSKVSISTNSLSSFTPTESFTPTNITLCFRDNFVINESTDRSSQKQHDSHVFLTNSNSKTDLLSITNAIELQQSNLNTNDVSKGGQFICHVDLDVQNNKNNCKNSTNAELKKSKKCLKCEQSFATSYLLKCHLRIHSGQRSYRCSLCGISFIHCGSRSRHVRQSHPELLKFACDECDKLFEQKKSLDHHRLSHSKEQEITCKECEVNFKSTREHFRHQRQVHKNMRYSCETCGLCFPYPSKLKLHLMSKHNATKPYMCEICGSSFSENNMLTTHKNIHTGEKKYECVMCGRRFLLKTTLTNHIQTHLDRKPYTCEVCGMGFKLSYYLKSHMKIHSQNRDRPHICLKCGRAFLKLAQLRNHERKHTGEKPYKCEICNSFFSQLSSMKKHVKQIHEGVKPKSRFSCEFCGLSFTHACKLKLHLMKHTGERPFACTICGSSYRENHQLVTHMKVHDGSEPFKCLICERRFLQKASLESHIRKHTGEKPFKCPICYQQFSHKGYLRDHAKIHDENRERKYKCGICDKAFTCSSHMRSHERLHLGEKPHKCHICGSKFTKRSSVKKHLKRTHGVHETNFQQVQGSELKKQESTQSLSIDVHQRGNSAELQKRNDQQCFELHDSHSQQTRTRPQTHGQLHVDLPAKPRPVYHVGIDFQMSSSELASLHPGAHSAMQAQIQQGMFARLHGIHSSNQHNVLHPHSNNAGSDSARRVCKAACNPFF